MRKRKFPAPPAPANGNEQSVQAARAIANAINQGLPGDQFASLMNVMHSKNVRLAARLLAATRHPPFRLVAQIVGSAAGAMSRGVSGDDFALAVEVIFSPETYDKIRQLGRDNIIAFLLQSRGAQFFGSNGQATTQFITEFLNYGEPEAPPPATAPATAPAPAAVPATV